MWSVKYYSDWKDLKGNDNRIEILTKDSVVAKEVKIASFTITHPTIDLFADTAVYGSGANITLLSKNRLDYFNELYSVNPQTFLFKHYLNNSLNFIGYLDTEQYQDSFANGVNYDFSITANDGISVLDRIKISDNNGDELNGIYNALEVIKYALNKLNISYDNIYLGVSTTIENIASDETLLHKLNVKSANYVDEKGNWMSCREVINAILLPLTLKMYIIGNDVYIVDIHKLASEDNLTLKQYKFSDLSYVQDVTITNLFEINKTLNNAVLNKKSGVNKVDVKFNKYVYDDTVLIPIDDTTLDDFTSEETITNSDNDEYFVQRFSSNENYINLIGDNSVQFEIITKTDSPSDVDYTVRLEGDSRMSQTPIWLLEVHPHIHLISSTLYIRLVGNAMVCENDNDFMKQDVTETNFLNNMYLQFKVGDKYYDHTNGWNTSPDSKIILSYLYDTTNKWYDLTDGWATSLGSRAGISVPLNNDIIEGINSIEGGELSIKLGMYITKNWTHYITRFKNLGFKFYYKDQWGNYLEIENSDIEYQGTINENYVNSLSIETNHGTDNEGNSRGVFLINISGNYTDSDYATNQRTVALNSVSRAGNEGTTEELLLNTYLSNLQKSRNQLSVTLLNYYSMINTFNYKVNSKLENLKFIPISMTADYINAETSVQLLEFVKDELL